MDDNKRTISPPSPDKDPKLPRLNAPLANNADKTVIKLTAPILQTGDIANTLCLMVLMEKNENVHNSAFAGLHWTLTKCRALVSNNPALKRAVRDCFEKEVLDPLREYISGMKRSKTDQRGAPGLTFPRSDDAEVIQHAWRMDYKGDAANLFVQALHDMNTNRGRYIYVNFVPIIQSSGTGKSRMGDEAAKYIFTLPFNLRSSRETSGYPLRDSQVYDFFSGNVTNRSIRDVQFRYLSFLLSLFTEVNHRIKQHDIFQSYEDFAKDWRHKLSEEVYRYNLYSEVVKTASERENPNTIGAAEEQVDDSLQQLLATIDEHSSKNDLMTYSSSTGKSKINPVRVMLYFDESQELLSIHTNYADRNFPHRPSEQQSAYQILCNAFGACVKQNLFVVYLSTNLTLSNYSPYQGIMWSYRTVAGDNKLQAPIVELPFDTFAKVEEDKLTLQEVSEPGHMVQFGRPLFWTRWQAALALWSRHIQNDLFRFARTKILGLQDPDGNLTGKQESTKRDGELAALGIRLMLEFEPLRESADREAKLVEGHMRIAYSVPKHRQYLRGGTSSEPVLAEAAARIMNEMPALLTTITGYLKHGLISKGERGELVARLLLTLAHDKCVKFDYRKAGEAQYSSPVPVVDFLAALVGPTHLKVILESRPDNVHDGVTFEEAFKDAKVNFTHFVKGNDSSIITDNAAWMALSRCMAFQCATGQWMIDLYIPVLLWDEPLGRYVVSGIFIQIKNQLKKQPVEIDATQLEFFSDPPAGHAEFIRYNERPYIALVMHLGIQPGSSNGSATENKVSEDEATAWIPPRSSSTTPADLNIETDKSTHPRYAITIVGCSNAVYNVVEKEDEDKFATLITSSDIVDEHPRQGDSFIRGVLRLKPYWTMQAQSFHWATSDGDKTGGGPRQKFVEGVYVAPPLGDRVGKDDASHTKDDAKRSDDNSMAVD